MDRRGTQVDDGAGAALSVEAAWALLPRVLAAIGGTPWWQIGEAEIPERIQLLGRAENQVVAAQVSGLGEAFARGLPIGSGFKSGGSWLRGLVALTPAAAVQRAKLAEELTREDLAPTRAAFTAGEIGVGPAAAITRTMTELVAIPAVDATTWAEAQHLLLGHAKQLDARQLGRLGAHLRNRLDPDAADRLAKDEDAQQAARQATLTLEGSGMWWLTASLPATDGALLATALDVLA
jgi:hypothetical protein